VRREKRINKLALQLGLGNATVGKWWRRFVEQGVSGLHGELRPGRPRPISDERVAQLVRKTLETKPEGGTHWSVRQIAGQTRLSKSTVHRIWWAFGLQPHRQRHFKLSTDPFFVGEGARHRRVVLESPAERGRAVCGREEPDSGAGTHPADAAHRAGLRGRRNPRIPAPWDHHLVCRPGHGQGHRTNAV
jgi:putative transposase